MLRFMGCLGACGGRSDDPPPEKSVWREGETHGVRMRVVNNSSSVCSVFWLDYQGQPQAYGSIKPGRTRGFDSYSTHVWRLELAAAAADGSAASSAGGRRHQLVLGASCLLTLRPSGRLVAQQLPGDDGHSNGGEPGEGDDSWMKPEWGSYRERARAMFPIMAFDCVSDAAVDAAACCVSRMLAHCRPDIITHMVAADCRIAIIGRHQLTTDIPAHRFMRRQAAEGGRDVDASARGLGATRAVPTLSCGEENCLMVDDRRYCKESVLVHELAHGVMALGFSEGDTTTIHLLYAQALQQRLYDPDCYMMENADEYWAEATQAWFGATTRTDVNSGINTRRALQQHDPGLAHLLAQVYGAGNAWQYTDDCPGAFAAS